MKVFLFLFLFSSNIFAKDISGSFKYNDYDKAESAESTLMFSIESVKAGLFSSTHVGYIKSFEYSADISEKVIKQMSISFSVKEMDTDNSIRDEKLHNECMKISEHPRLNIVLLGKVSFEELEKGKVLQGKVNILGKDKTFKAKVSGEIEDEELEIEVESTWGFKEMEIPDPSILIAKVKNEIQIKLKLDLKLKD